ncbi:MAG TPA: lysylphosphatidylglycerol synthase transmembrane domain-containing protein, partial [Candidatus Omnitrophota bacterium]|nr:lysylphosphatidylglycerol synthase transmembrane domain-containing protein [Candidatus Omnitrophota bacterium]
ARTIDISLHSKKHSSRVLATVVLDRIGGFCGLMAVLAGALLFGYKLLNDASVIIVSLILFFIIIFIFAVAFSTPFFKLVCCLVPFKKLKDYLTQLHEATASYKNDPKALFKVFLVSLIIQGGLSVVYFWIALSVGIKTGLIYYFIFVPVISVISVIPVSIGGLGLRDAASVAFLAKAGITAEGALALSLSNFAFIFAVGFTGGMVYVIDIYRRRIQRH